MKRTAHALPLALIAAFVFALTTRSGWAQQQVTPMIPLPSPAPVVTVTPEGNDARAASCSAFNLPNFAPYVVRAGDRLADLIVNAGSVTVTQIAALNCIDDPDALPVGAVIWLPMSAGAAAATAEVTLEAGVESTAEAAPTIARFAASAESVINTETVTFAWSAAGDAAYFYLCPADDCQRPHYAEPLPLDGAVEISGFQSAGTYRYRLDVAVAGDPVSADVTVAVTCAQPWLGGVGASPRCPIEPARTIFGVWQPFEGGVMLWFSDTGQIYVMTNDGRFTIYADQYADGQPDPAAQAPEGLYTPVRGFGMVWSEIGGAASPLGWALAPEVGYDAARQAAGSISYTTYVQAPGDTVYALTQFPGIADGYWSQVAG